MKAVAEAPLSITGFWAPVPASKPEREGSIGAALVLEPRLKLALEPSEALEVQGVPLFPALRRLTSRLDVKAKVTVESPAPLGYGFGVSASTCLALSMAWAALTKKPVEALAREAHICEVVERSGLGDVIVQFYGGPIAARTKPGAPGYGEVVRIPVPRGLVVLAAPLTRMETRKLLEAAKKAYGLAHDLLAKLLESPSIEAFLSCAAEFSRTAGFLSTELEEALRAAPGAVGYYVKKGVAVVVVEESHALDAKGYLEGKVKANPLVLKPTWRGAEAWIEK